MENSNNTCKNNENRMFIHWLVEVKKEEVYYKLPLTMV